MKLGRGDPYISSTVEATDDLRLIERSRRGDHAAFAQLVERYKDAVYRLTYRILRHAGDAEEPARERCVSLAAANPRPPRARKTLATALAPGGPAYARAGPGERRARPAADGRLHRRRASQAAAGRPRARAPTEAGGDQPARV